MADRLILEDGTGFIILEDDSGVLEINDPTSSSPSLSFVSNAVDSSAKNISSFSAEDWKLFGIANRKATGGNLISDLTVIGNPKLTGVFGSDSQTVSYTDGLSPTSGSSNSVVFYDSDGITDAGGSFTVPAGVGERTVSLIASKYDSAGAVLRCTLSNGAAAQITQSFPGAGDVKYLHVISFSAAEAGQSLLVEWFSDTGIEDSGVAIHAVWLSEEQASIGFTELAVAASNIITAAGIINTGILLQGAAVSLGGASANVSTGVTFTGAALSLVNASGDIASPTQFFANAQDVATLTGAMTTAIRAAVNAMGVSTGTGNISTGINMAGDAQDNVSASGQVNSQIRFVANAADVASASGGLSTGVNLNGFAASIVTVNGNPTMQIRLSADALSQVLASAGFNTGVLFNGDAQDIVNATVALSTAIRAAGNAQGQASASAGLSIGAGLSGNAQDTVVVTVALNTQIRLSGSPQAVSAAVASLSGVATQMQAQAVGVVSASAALTTGAKLSGNAQDVVTAIVNITTQIPLTAAVLAQAISGGQIITNIRLSGFAADDAGSSGTLSFAATVTPYSFSTKASSHQAIISHLAPQSLRCNAQATTYIDTEVRLAA